MIFDIGPNLTTLLYVWSGLALIGAIIRSIND